jgi:hypothetical protein
LGCHNKRDIIALERKVKETFANDRSSPEMYSTIKELAGAILVVKHMAFNSTEVEEISHMLATDFYIKINHEGLVVEKWTKYIRLRLYKMRSLYLDETKGIELEVKDIVEADQFRQVIFGSVNSATNQEVLELESVIQSIPNILLEIFDKYVRYKIGSSEYESVKLSVMLTIEDKIKHDRGRIVLIGLGFEYESYVRFMVNLMYKRLAVYLHKIFGEDLSRSSEMKELISSCWNINNMD